MLIGCTCVCSEGTLEKWFCLCVMFVNAQLQYKAIKRSISGHVEMRFGSQVGVKKKYIRRDALYEYTVLILFFKFVIQTVQKLFDSFDAV